LRRGNRIGSWALSSSDRELFFETDYLKNNLKGRSVRGGVLTLICQGILFLLQLLSIAVLARFLTPEDYGLIAMVTAVIGFSSLFKNMGLLMATIQKETITHEQVTALFWLNVLISILVALMTSALAPLIAVFYGDERLTFIGIFLSLSFIFEGFAVQHQALLRRQMRFVPLAIIPVIALIAGATSAVISALMGASYWSLVIMILVKSFTNTVLVWFFCGWFPGGPARNANIRELMLYGANLTGFNVLNYFARNLDDILIGKFCGASSLGIYNKAYGLLMLPLSLINGPIANVAIPALSRLQNEPESYKSYYCNALSLIAYMTFPMILGLTVMADEMVFLVLGPQWDGVSSIFIILAIAAFGQPIANANGWIYTSLGQTNRMFRWGLISVPVIVLGFIIGLPWGAIGVAASYAVSANLIRIPGFWWAFRFSPINMRDLIHSIWRPAVSSFAMALTMFGVRLTLIRNTGSSSIILISCLVIGLIAFFITMLSLPNGRADMLKMMDMIKTISSSKDYDKTG